jgi:hypothetical protein
MFLQSRSVFESGNALRFCVNPSIMRVSRQLKRLLILPEDKCAFEVHPMASITAESLKPAKHPGYSDKASGSPVAPCG